MMNAAHSANRLFHIDIAKGISITLVALFNSHFGDIYPELMRSLGLFRIPLFFFLSGVFFSISDPFSTMIRKKSDALLKPYFFTLLVVLAVSLSFDDTNLAWKLRGIAWGNGDTIAWSSLWFLTHLWAVFVFAYIVTRVTQLHKRALYIKLIYLVVATTVGALTIDLFWYSDMSILGRTLSIPGLPFSLDFILITSSFFFLGSFLRSKITSFVPNLYVCAACLIALVAISLLTDSRVYFDQRIYTNPLFSTLGALTGIYIVLTVSYYLSFTELPKRAILWLGQASLFILIFHVFIGSTIYDMFAGPGDETDNYWVSLSAFIASVILPVGFKYLAENVRFLAWFYFPFSVKAQKAAH